MNDRLFVALADPSGDSRLPQMPAPWLAFVLLFSVAARAGAADLDNA